MQIPSDLKQNDWIRACKKLGIEVNCTKGKGSHCLIKHSKTGELYTIQRKLHRVLNIKIFNRIKKWGFYESDIWEALK